MNSRQFNNLFSDSSNSNCFSLFHLNIRSFKKHSVDLEEYLSTLNTSFSAIGLSETWLDTTSNDLCSIPGYHFISKPRPLGSGGGVGIFLCDTYEYKKRCDLESMNWITPHSATLIDDILSNDLDNHRFSGILWSDISDHLPIFQITNYSLKPKSKSSVYHKRLITTHNFENFVPIFVLLIGISHNLPLQMHCAVLLWHPHTLLSYNPFSVSRRKL